MSSNSERVMTWRKRMKQKLVAAFGGRCGICGYDKCIRALSFHHLDPSQKEFAVGNKGIPRAWKKICEEAAKCVMLCRNCHDEVHDGITDIPSDIRRFVEPAPMPMRKMQIRERKRNPVIPRPIQEKVPDRPRGKNLRDLVYRTSRVAVAKTYGVSETAVRKWLKIDSERGLSQEYMRP